MVQFVKSVNLALAAQTLPKDLKVSDPASVQAVARTIAAGAMSYYSGTATQFADLPKPYYWWQCGALMGAMLDYSHYTRDESYDNIISTALLAQVGPNYDFMTPAHYGDLGNDDLGFWGFAVMSAAERNFPQPESSVPSWLTMGENIWNSLASRWNTTACGGGLLWQIFASNPNGLNYKNSVSNGGFFQLSARLARATGNQTYADWAARIYDWSAAVGFITADHEVKDGAHAAQNCTDTNQVSFTYSQGIYLYGAAVMANLTAGAANATDADDQARQHQLWLDRTGALLQASERFFTPYDNATSVLYEPACERVSSCNADMKSHKGYLSRFMYASSLMVPSVRPKVESLLSVSAAAAATTCTGGPAGTSCGHKWYWGRYDGDTGLGQEMCALETVQGILVGQSTPPLRAGEIRDVRTPRAGNQGVPAATTTAAKASSTASSSSAGTSVLARRSVSGGDRVLGGIVDLAFTSLGLAALTGALIWGMI